MQELFERGRPPGAFRIESIDQLSVDIGRERHGYQ